MATLAAIKTKVRRLTKRPSTIQLTEDELLEYINDFYLNDFPQRIQTEDLTQSLSFATTPNVDVYESSESVTSSLNLEDFKDKVVDLEGPVFLSGQQIMLSRSPNEFFNLYPPRKAQLKLGVGDAATVAYTFSIGAKIVPNTLIIGSSLASGEAIIVHDVPTLGTYGRNSANGVLYDEANTVIGDVQYFDGTGTITFAVAPGLSKPITLEAQTYVTGQPDTMLFYNGEFTLRPIPDRVFEVKFQARIQPVEFALNTDTPKINQWSNYIAYGAAKKILEDLGDSDALQRIFPGFIEQEELVNAKTNLQYAKQSTVTFYDSISNSSTIWPWGIDG